MSRSKVNHEHKKPFKWWVHKLLAEFYYFMDDINAYYVHLERINKMGFNIYGEKI